MTRKEELVEARLAELGIPFIRHDHEPVMTVAEGMRLAEKFGAACMKNLFLCAKKRQHYLLMMRAEKSFSSREVAGQLGCGHLSFGSPEKMEELLGTRPGAVTCLGLLFDTGCKVQVLVDRDLPGAGPVDCHPCSNAASLTIAIGDLLGKWLPATGHGGFIIVDV